MTMSWQQLKQPAVALEGLPLGTAAPKHLLEQTHCSRLLRCGQQSRAAKCIRFIVASYQLRLHQW